MESDFVEWLRARVRKSPEVPLGIGDDAAALNLASTQCVACTDMLMDGTDFVLGECDPRLIGRKALAVNLSDLAAMAAKPVAALVSLAVHRDMELEVLRSIYDGLIDMADEYGVAIIGGDTNSWQHPLAISVTAIGEPTGSGVLTRGGARPGDAIVVSGSFGGSILGRHLKFTPRVEEAIELHTRFALNACIDVSDGLSLDLYRLAEASGCGAKIDPATIPISDAAVRLAAGRENKLSALEHAFCDGEDFELIMAVIADDAAKMLKDQPLKTALTRIGEFVAEPGLWQTTESGTTTPLIPRGYEH